MIKNRHAPKMSEASSNATLSLSKQLLKNIHPLMSASFCSLTKTYLQWPHRKKTEWPYAHPSINVATIRLCTLLLTFSHWWHHSASHKGCASLIFADHWVKIGEVTLLQQFLPATRQISSEFFIFHQQDSQRTGCILRQSTFPNNFSKCWAISKILPEQTQR